MSRRSATHPFFRLILAAAVLAALGAHFDLQDSSSSSAHAALPSRLILIEKSKSEPIPSIASGIPPLAQVHPVCLPFHDALRSLDFSKDPYFNQLNSGNVAGQWECIKGLENITLVELKASEESIRKAKESACAGRVGYPERSIVVACRILRALHTPFDVILRDRIESPLCSEFYRMRDHEPGKPEIEFARYHQDCARERDELELRSGMRSARRSRSVEAGSVVRMEPRCGQLDTRACEDQVRVAAEKAGCKQARLSCNENLSYCEFSSLNCTPPDLEFESFPASDSGRLHSCPYPTDAIVPVASPIPFSFLCRW